MEHANVPLVARTWRPCLLCGLLLASKVWQDLRFVVIVVEANYFHFGHYHPLFPFSYYLTLSEFSTTALGTVKLLKFIHNSHYKLSTNWKGHFVKKSNGICIFRAVLTPNIILLCDH